jgi:hypothetical protein
LLERVVTALNQLIVHPNVIPFTWFGVTMFQYATTSKFIAMACERLRVPQVPYIRYLDTTVHLGSSTRVG